MIGFENKIKKLPYFNSEHRATIEKIVEKILETYKDRLTSFIIFGSYARGEAKLNSDLDILIILKEKSTTGKELDFFNKKVEIPVEKDLQKLYETWGINLELSPIIFSEEEAKYFNPLYLDMVENSIIVYDKDGFFSKILKKISEIKKKVKKVNQGNTFIWEMVEENPIGEKLI
jgi:predicted nucleotidyltransferase